MPKEEFNKISFNNFKPFGEKMQTFTAKPITLIYGPNSIGKSSLLHSVLYKEYIKLISKDLLDNADLNLYSTHNFGDKLDLGGFGHYIHGHDEKAHLKYSTELKKDNDIAKILSPFYLKIKKFKEDGTFKILDELLGDDPKLTNIETILKLGGLRIYIQKENTYYMHQLHKKIYNSAIRIEDKERIKNNFTENNKFDPSDDIDSIFKECLKSNKNLSDICYRDDGAELDALDIFILFLMDNSPRYDKFFSFKEEVLDLFDFGTLYEVFFREEILFSRYLSNISSIKLENEIFYSEEEQHFINKNKFYVDNELLFSVVQIKRWGAIQKSYFKIKKKHPFFKILFSKEKNIRNKFIKYQIVSKRYIQSLDYLDIFTHHSYFIGKDEGDDSENMTNYLEDMIFHISNKAFYSGVDTDTQYIGPLRWLPGRDELTQKPNYAIIEHTYIDLDDVFKESKLNMKQQIESMPKSIRNYKIVLWTYFLFSLLWNILINLPKLISSAFHHPNIAEHFNIRKRNKDKVSYGKSKTTEKMWQDVIASKDIRNKLNKWLGDDQKLQSTYEIIVQEEVENNFIKRLFGNNTLKRLSFVDIKSNTEVLIKDMGLGISQILPVLFSCFTKKETKIFLEQPELHLHPAIQSELADEFIRSIKKNNNQFMIETHSEHLLLRIMKRMRYTAEGKLNKDDVLALTPNDVCLLYVDNDGDNTFINELELDEDGTLLDIWPNGFFEEGYHERFD